MGKPLIITHNQTAIQALVDEVTKIKNRISLDEMDVVDITHLIPSASDLPETGEFVGEAYLIGTEAPYDLRVWMYDMSQTPAELTWVDLHEYPRPGPTGQTGESDHITNLTEGSYDSNTRKRNWTLVTTQGNEFNFFTYDGATGLTGQNGLTPYIDPVTGNWKIGTSDTGVHAQGPVGQTGQTGQPGVAPQIQATLSNTSQLPNTITQEMINGGYAYIVESNDAAVDGMYMIVLYLNNVYNPHWERVLQLVGVPGEDGNSILYGSSSPANTTGNDGDLYVNTTSGLLSAKENGAWVSKINLKGTNGVGISNVQTITPSSQSGYTQVRITLTNSSNYDIFVKNGQDGQDGEGLILPDVGDVMLTTTGSWVGGVYKVVPKWIAAEETIPELIGNDWTNTNEFVDSLSLNCDTNDLYFDISVAGPISAGTYEIGRSLNFDTSRDFHATTLVSTTDPNNTTLSDVHADLVYDWNGGNKTYKLMMTFAHDVNDDYSYHFKFEINPTTNLWDI